MNNLFLLAGLTFFVSCTEGHKNMELVSTEAEEAKAIAIQEEKKLISEAGTQRQNLLNDLITDSSFADKINLSQKYMAQLPMSLNTKNRNDKLKKAESLQDLTHSLELLTRNQKFDNFSPFKMKSEEEKAFYSLAATLDSSENSLLRVIEQSFDPETSSESYISEEARELLINLLKARVDILSALSLQDIKEAQFTLKNASTKFLNGIQIDNKKITLGLESPLDSAVETMAFLKSIGIKHKLDNKTKRQLKKIKLDKKLKLTEAEEEKTEEIQELIEELIK